MYFHRNFSYISNINAEMPIASPAKPYIEYSETFVLIWSYETKHLIANAMTAIHIANLVSESIDFFISFCRIIVFEKSIYILYKFLVFFYLLITWAKLFNSICFVEFIQFVNIQHKIIE